MYQASKMIRNVLDSNSAAASETENWLVRR
jgi:hypothetical protein